MPMPTLSAPTPAEAATAGGWYGSRNLADPALAGPIDRAYRYLDDVQDSYLKGAEPRLLPSCPDGTALVHDNALAAMAYLANPTVANVRRARLIGDALLRAQAAGCLHPAYRADTGEPVAEGDNPAAWTGLALTQLYVDTRLRKYLDGAVALAAGVTAPEQASIVENVTAYALGRLLAKLTRNRRWTTRATAAADAVRARWDPLTRRFGDGSNDVQSLALLGLRDRLHDRALDGVSTVSPIVALALLTRGDPERARRLLRETGDVRRVVGTSWFLMAGQGFNPYE